MRRITFLSVLSFSCVALFAGFYAIPSAGAGQASTPAAPPAANATVRIGMKNVEFHLTDRIIVHIATLNGKLTTQPGKMPVFDDKTSFGIDVDSANVTVSMAALTNDLNDYVFAKPTAPLKKVSVSTQGQRASGERAVGEQRRGSV